MALLFMDGFEADDFLQKWVIYESPTTSATTRFSIGKSLLFNSNAEEAHRSFAPAAKVYAGFAFYFSAPSNYNYAQFSINGDGGSTRHLNLVWTAADTIVLYRGSTSIGSAVVPQNAWLYVQVSATIADAVGTATVRVNGVEVINFTGDTMNAGVATTIDKITIGNQGYFDDVYICDDTGATCNTFLGDVRVHTLMPTADTASADLTPVGSSSHYANVSEVPDSTATYNTSATVGHKDLYAMSDLPAGVTTIYGVQANNCAWKTDAGEKNLKNVIKSGATTAYGSTAVLSPSLINNRDIFHTDPATSVAWTASGVNGVEVGVEVA